MALDPAGRTKLHWRNRGKRGWANARLPVPRWFRPAHLDWMRAVMIYAPPGIHWILRAWDWWQPYRWAWERAMYRSGHLAVWQSVVASHHPHRSTFRTPEMYEAEGLAWSGDYWLCHSHRRRRWVEEELWYHVEFKHHRTAYEVSGW